MTPGRREPEISAAAASLPVESPAARPFVAPAVASSTEVREAARSGPFKASGPGRARAVTAGRQRNSPVRRQYNTRGMDTDLIRMASGLGGPGAMSVF